MNDACVVWLTGLSGSGKSTIARALRARLADCGHAAAVLDGDEIRQGLSRGLRFSEAERSENIRRIAEVARLLSSQGITVIVAAITPLSKHRRLARHIVGAAYREVYVKASLAACERRDVKGLYARARRGEVAQFTGVSDSYEAPTQADLLIDTSQRDLDSEIEDLMALLERFGIHRIEARELA
jgi:adenylylsulfate kinase